MTKRRSLWRWFQAISFQIIWLVLVLGKNQWIYIPIAILALHFWLTPSRTGDIRILTLSLIGFSIDMLLSEIGIFTFKKWPIWLLILWAAFVLNFGHSLSFLRRIKLSLSAVIGAIGGGYAYWASWMLGAVVWPYDPLFTVCLISMIWAVILPAMIKVDSIIRRNPND